ncbi:hypothetical protein [Nocardioides gilvus]|uniref:hypothetical protein n=1 Tax=Nocardioides gilvus TaxID=1735589 RepID=UPI000D74DFC2|nr:hypothetical protein [Nocardioides gilvus]
MNSLDDLRTTLRDHAHGIDGLDPVSRTTGVRARVAEQRRRRNAVRGGVALAAVAAVVSGVVLTDPGTGPTPDPAAGLGAPESFTALGWTYELADAVESDGSTQTISLPASERPYLISWKTEGESQDVTVTSRTESDTEPVDEPIWSSSAADWADHVVVNASRDEKITVSADDVAGIAVATYEIDQGEVPPGMGSGKADAFHFRERVAERVLLGAAVADGESETRLDYDVSGDRVTIAYSCSGLPKGAWIRLSLDGSDDDTTSGDSCDATTFDPGAGTTYTFSPREDWPREGTLRLWVSRSESDLTPLPASEVTGTKLGVALYSSDSSKLWGTESPTEVEMSGHAWKRVEAVDVEPGAPLRLDSLAGASAYDGPWLVQVAHEATTYDRVSFEVLTDGRTKSTHAFSSEGSGVGIMGDVLLPPSAETVSVEITEGADVVTRQALLFYRLAD